MQRLVSRKTLSLEIYLKHKKVVAKVISMDLSPFLDLRFFWKLTTGHTNVVTEVKSCEEVINNEESQSMI